jgi:hypothetical protein
MDRLPVAKLLDRFAEQCDVGVQVPARARVANASLTIMKSREKRLNEATAAALSHQLHSACIAWDLGEAN